MEDLFGGRVLPPTVIEPVQAAALGLADWDPPENSSPAHIGSLERRTLQIVAQDQTGEDLASIEVLPPYDRTVLTAEQLLFFMLVRALRWAWHSDERLRWVLYREAPSILRDTTPVGQMLLDTRADGAMADVAAADRMSGSQLRQTVNDQLTNLARRAFLQQRLHGIDGAASGYDLSRLVQVWIDAHRNIMYEIEVGDPVSLNGSYRERTTRTFGTPTVGGTADTGRRRVVDLRDGVEREINHGGRRMPQSTAFGVATMDIGNPEWDPVPEAPESTDRYVARWTTLTGDLVEEFALPGSMDLASVRSSSDFLLGVDINGTHYPSEGALRGADWQGQYFRAVIALEQKMLSVGQRYSELVQFGRDRLRKLQKDAEPKYEDWREANP
ncbi:MAG: hypothetical protein M5U09_24990 [Gammaproteobacteria bacterium]|nr:hypothetical protein [Gammaproteobacteria bacterium]